ncbi:hypothetical protein T05_12979 [Trichinella murrelli]|uniref:Uncharacterized protein n=1 Tax=Trichinella murrelli TaxID=144512 RepID=A0A0V0U997_9BILA|nr:hypothetical protein T05_12979 [Trichinella murrelli]
MQNFMCYRPVWFRENQIGKFFDIKMKYSLIVFSFVQYFVILGKLIFLHNGANSNKLKKVVSIRVAICIKSSIR